MFVGSGGCGLKFPPFTESVYLLTVLNYAYNWKIISVKSSVIIKFNVINSYKKRLANENNNTTFFFTLLKCNIKWISNLSLHYTFMTPYRICGPLKFGSHIVMSFDKCPECKTMGEKLI